ncbi:MAG TPA: hypothetical protein VL400_05975 [Polyangiaceae bacterium]|jgi:hypothetical protein|nr:hypothetical protein [Polyangiaceae bacterium]
MAGRLVSRPSFVSSFALGILFVAGCGAPLPMPETGDHSGEIPVPVPYPPPPARVDVVLEPPAELAHPVWVDGEWLWKGSRWVWDPGGWVENDPTQVYAKSMVVRRADGQLVWFAGEFRPKPGAVRGGTSSP